MCGAADLAADGGMAADRPVHEGVGTAGPRLAEEFLPKTYSVTENKVRKTISKRLAAHVLLPRAQGSMHFKFKIMARST